MHTLETRLQAFECNRPFKERHPESISSLRLRNESQSSVFVRVCVCVRDCCTQFLSTSELESAVLPLADWCSWKQESDFPSQETALHLQKFWERGDLLHLWAGRSWIIWKNCGPGLLRKQNGLIRENWSCQKVIKWIDCSSKIWLNQPCKMAKTRKTNRDSFLLLESTIDNGVGY